MLKLYNKVLLCNNKNEVWKIVGFSEKVFDSQDKMPMVKIISNGKVTFVSHSDLTLVSTL